MSGGTVTAALMASLVATLTSATDLNLPGRDVRLSDVAELSGDGAAPSRDTIIARLPGSLGTRTLTRREIAALARHAVPLIQIKGDLTGAVTVRSVMPVRPHAPAAPYAPLEPTISRGEKLELISNNGPVSIQRSVVALQPASASQRQLFVRTEDGQVFSAPIKVGEAK